MVYDQTVVTQSDRQNGPYKIKSFPDLYGTMG